MTPVYRAENLQEARLYLKQIDHKVIITNSAGSSCYYGMRVVACMINKLLAEFPEKIESVVINTDDTAHGFVTATKLFTNLDVQILFNKKDRYCK